MNGSIKKFRYVALIALLALRLAACGGNPAGPSGDVTLEGTVIEGQGALGQGYTAASGTGTAAAVITVSVAENRDLSTTVSGGRFSLAGLPPGSFTLVFSSNGRQVGSVPFADVAPSTALAVTVMVSSSSVSLVSEQRNGNGGGQGNPNGPQVGPSPAACMINGGRPGDGIELEGRVATGAYPTFTMNVNGNRASGPVSVVAGAAATVQCSPAGGPNAPTTAECQARVSGNQRIHVRGTLTSCTPTDALVTASRIIVQGN
jgi:hypothetical protein